MINFYSNMSFDEMMKEISYENYDFYIPLIKEQQAHLFETFYDSEPIIKEIFGN